MVDAASAGGRPLHPGLPEEIIIWEILVRLPPKALLRCRAVCRAWRHATSARDFLLAHHAYQPTLPLLYGYDYCDDTAILDIGTLDTRAGIAAADQLQSIARLGDDWLHPDASCDGLLILYVPGTAYAICNLATRQFGPLPLPSWFSSAGMYRHAPTGDYRLLLYTPQKDIDEYELEPDVEYACHVFALGSCQPPRHIGWPEAAKAIRALVPGVLFGDSLHWHLSKESGSHTIMAFDSTTESFRKMRAPVVSGGADLFEMDDMLCMSSFNHATALVNVWVMEDYENEAWALKYQVQLPVPEISTQIQEFRNYWKVVVMPCGGDLLVLVKDVGYLLQVYIGSTLVASFQHTCLDPTQVRLKQTLVPHTLIFSKIVSEQCSSQYPYYPRELRYEV